jgi:hypothetical protein
MHMQQQRMHIYICAYIYVTHMYVHMHICICAKLARTWGLAIKCMYAYAAAGGMRADGAAGGAHMLTYADVC